MAPDFTLADQDGNEVSLSGLSGKAVMLYFYPKADTPGCTTQACGVRDHRAAYADAGAVVLGISPDPVAKVKKFHEKHRRTSPCSPTRGMASPIPMGCGWRSRCMAFSHRLG